MTTIEEAAKILDTKIESLDKFKVVDDFNDNILEGFLCREPNHKYGALFLTRVNDEYCKQLIYCTPKLEYPFDRKGEYHFPECKEIQFYEKVDGTNIFSYHYYYKDVEYITFKTRLTPVVKDQKFGTFKSMWKEYLKENDWAMQVIKDNPLFNLSFELFGLRNPITIQYDELLEVNLLFGVKRGSSIIKPPNELNISDKVKIPMNYTMVGDDNLSDLVERYNKHREHMSIKNKEKLTIEGMVQYCHVGLPSWKMFKCKPEEIEKIHWTASGYIPNLSLFNTALNVFESYDNPTINDFVELLKEEYPDTIIIKSLPRIQNNWEKAVNRIEFTQTVNEIWMLAKKEGLDITKDKNETMRFISKYFPKNIMNKVGGTVLRLAGLL